MGDFYESREGAEAYRRIAQGYDGSALISTLKQHLAPGKRVLELGIGPGTDLLLLAQDYEVVGSDFSQAFLDLFAQEHPEIPVLCGDAERMNIEGRFDAIYSNKVLIHLSPEALRTSFAAQLGVLSGPESLVLHAFWRGTGKEELKGETFYYYEPETVLDYAGSGWVEVDRGFYAEIDNEDSFWILLRPAP